MSNQPAAARAVRNKFHPYKQVYNRLTALAESGHPTSKLEIIVMGGTWSFLPHRYQSWYLKRCYDAANEFGLSEAKKKAYRKIATTLKKSQTHNETADHRIIGLTLETRPDFINERELVRMRRYGCTRVEIGVQTLNDDIQRLTKRGHSRKHVIKAMKLMKDFGFKVCWHLMPGLPGSTPENDLEWMKEVFANPDMCPDFIKIYPCVVLETAELKEWWERGDYTPYHDDDLVKLLTQFQTFVPEWTRIMRLMRDIPVSNILDGAKFSNLRQILKDQPGKLRELVGDKFYDEHNLAENSYVFRDIRAREVGFADFDKNPELLTTKPVLVRRDYTASEGQEVFLSFEDEAQEHLFALLRLRKPSGQEFKHYASALKNAAFIRELFRKPSPHKIEVFMGKRKTRSFNGLLGTPGGNRDELDEKWQLFWEHIRKDVENPEPEEMGIEPSLVAAARELRQEVGLIVPEVDRFKFLRRTTVESVVEAVKRVYRVDNFLLCAEGMDPKNTSPEEHGEMDWHDVDAVLTLHKHKLKNGGQGAVAGRFAETLLGLSKSQSEPPNRVVEKVRSSYAA